MKIAEVVLASCLHTIFNCVCSGSEPCSSYKQLGLTELRSPNSKMEVGGFRVCDDFLPKDWYRAGNYHVMAMSPPPILGCTTTFPAWMSGHHPNSTNETAVVKVCIAGFLEDCEYEHHIQVKNCGEFMIYELTPLDFCGAYCFVADSTLISCNTVEPVTNVYVEFDSFTWTEIQGRTNASDPSLNLICRFTPASSTEILYDIRWYMNNDKVKTVENITKLTLEKALLNAHDMLAAGKRMESWVQCFVDVRIEGNNLACNTNASKLFYMGIENLTPQIIMQRGEEKTIRLQPTIPFAGYFQLIDGEAVTDPGYLNISLVSDHKISDECVQGDTKSISCAILIETLPYKDRHRYNDSSVWQKVYEFNITTKESEMYDITGQRIVRLEATGLHGLGSKIYNNVFLKDTVVQIVDNENDWKGKVCSSLTDPHVKTFDDTYFECQVDGIYILYKNEMSNQEVQVQHHKCHPSYSYPYCTCAVAVRAGKSIFVVDICNGLEKAFIDFTFCRDEVLDAIRIHDKQYKVYMPSGTAVTITIRTWPNQETWQIDVLINPSIADIGKTSGLCGLMDNDKMNDFTYSTREKDSVNPAVNYYANFPNGFINSWKVDESKIPSLFANSVELYNSLNLISMAKTHVHLCKCNATETKTECNAKSSPRCVNTNAPKLPCKVNIPDTSTRKKRFADVSFTDKNSKKDTLKRQKRQTLQMTVEKAEEICNEAFQDSSVYSMCIQNVKDFSNTSFMNCVMDVSITADTNITKIHVEAALEQCATFVALNTTLQTEQPNIAYELRNLCPNNCSFRGLCTGGNCTCDHGFAGSDCSFDMSGPPVITRVSNSGLCDKYEENCQAATVNGRYFLDNYHLSCYVDQYEIARNGTSTLKDSFVTDVEPKTIFQGYCPITDGNSQWITEFQFNITNDGVLFTDTYNIFVYHSLCQQLHNNTDKINFSLKEGFCFILGSCVQNGTVSTTDTCAYCNSALNENYWTTDPGCLTTTSTFSPSISNNFETNATQQTSIDTQSTTYQSTSDGSAVGQIILYNTTSMTSSDSTYGNNIISLTGSSTVNTVHNSERKLNKESDDHTIVYVSVILGVLSIIVGGVFVYIICKKMTCSKGKISLSGNENVIVFPVPRAGVGKGTFDLNTTCEDENFRPQSSASSHYDNNIHDMGSSINLDKIFTTDK